MLTRRGTTLAELLIAVALASLVLATATASLLRQQRTATGLAAHAAVVAQLHPATSAVVAQLAHVSPAAGDFVAGEWRDTALQFRAPIATGVSCDAAPGAVTLPSPTPNAIPLGGTLSPPRAGDSLWSYSDSAASWTGRAIAGIASAGAACGRLDGGPAVRLLLATPDTVPEDSPIRITRQLRLVIYRGSDGGWSLGLREWSEAAKELGSPQPIAGPFLASAASGERTGFRFFDASGVELHRDREASLGDRVRRVRLTFVGAGKDGRAPRGVEHPLVDSLDVALASPHAP